jgi:hypothetical protein
MTDTKLHGYQDDLDTTGHDDATHDVTDSPADSLGTPNQAIGAEFNKTDGRSGSREDHEDWRETIEDLDQGSDDR